MWESIDSTKSLYKLCGDVVCIGKTKIKTIPLWFPSRGERHAHAPYLQIESVQWDNLS